MATITQQGPFTLEGFAPTARSRKGLWIGRGLSGLGILFMTFDAVGKLLELDPVVKTSGELGFAAHTIFGLGVIEALSVVLYVIPRTSLLGAVLLTGWFGGAIATHVSHGSPLLSHTLFPLYIAALLWGGLSLRSSGLRALVSGQAGR